MPTIPFSKLRKLLAPETETGVQDGKRPTEAPGQTKVAPGVQAVDSLAQDSDPDDVLRVIRQPKRAVVLVTPFAAEDYSKAAAVQRYGNRCVKDSLGRGESPLASHLFYYEVLNVKNPIERDIGLLSQLTWMRHCDMVAVYIDFGVTKAMEVAINTAQLSHKKIEYRTIGSVS